MNKLLLSSMIVAAFALSGCATDGDLVKPEPVVVKQTDYVVRIPPAGLMTLPPPVAKINLDDPELKQSVIAQWVIDTDERMKKLEDRLKGIAKFFVTEQAKADAQATNENEKAVIEANNKQAQAALSAASSPKK